MKHLVFILALIGCLASTALSCSMIGGLEFPLKGANINSYIFVGEVIGYTEIIKSGTKPNSFETEDKFLGEGRGLKIKLIAAINLPKVPTDYFELYKFGVTTWCVDELRDAGYLKIGTKLRIVAHESTVLPASSTNHIRLESKIFDRFSVVADDEFVPDESSEFDYQNNWKLFRDKFPATKEYEKAVAFDDFIYLQTNKDLLRLKHATSKKRRYEILERLLYNPKVDFPALISAALGRNSFLLLPNTFLKDGEKAKPKEKAIRLTKTEKELLKKRQELETAGYFK